MKNSMQVLSLSYAQELFVDTNKALGDTLARSMGYSAYLDYYAMIIHTLKKTGYRTRLLTDSFVAIPTNGLNRMHSLMKMYTLASGICAAHHIDLIQSQDPIFTGFIAYLLKKRYRIPINVCLYGGNIYDPHWLKQKLIYRICAGTGKLILKKADGIQVEGSLIKESLISHQLDPDKISVKPMVPHNLDNFIHANGEEVRKKLLANTYEHIVLFVGRLIKEKNLVPFLGAMKLVFEHLPRTLLVIIGDGSERITLHNTAEKLSILKNIHWMTHIAHSELPQYYRAADIFVLFSVSEGFPRVLMEAAAAGLPIISSRISGSTDAISDGKTGYIVRIDDAADFVQKIEYLLQNIQLRKQMSLAAPQFIKKIGTFDENISKQILIWEKISGAMHSHLAK